MSKLKLNVGIIGATGYAGSELCRLLSMHPNVEKLYLSSTSSQGKSITEIYPSFAKRIEIILSDAKSVISNSDVVFAALPSGEAENYANICSGQGIAFIDISADFRFDDDGETYFAWYGLEYKYPHLHKISVYGLPEMNRDKIKAAASDYCQDASSKPRHPLIIGNPGCYPTSITLGAMPALKLGIAGDGTIIADSASGVTGGGRETARAYHYPECADNVSPYKVGGHRHTPEISRNLSVIENRIENQRHIIFTPHLCPMNRGILSTIYIPLSDQYIAHSCGLQNSFAKPRPYGEDIKEKLDLIHKMYSGFYKDEYFVRVLPQGIFASPARVRNSNYCDISVHIDQSGRTLIVTSAIDNMVKGAAGQAIQNLNIIFGFEEQTALLMIPSMF